MPIKPSEQEEEYFAKLEFERRKHALAAPPKPTDEAVDQQEVALAQHRCPKCGAALVAVPYKGMEIDQCSRCQGVWLDDGAWEQVIAGERGFLTAIKRLFPSGHRTRC